MKCSRIGQKMKIKGIKDILGFFLLLISLFLLGKMIRFCLSPDIWYDEVFSTKMISGSFKEITRFTARDVHPPFYYWYLKVFVQAGRMILGTLREYRYSGETGINTSPGRAVDSGGYQNEKAVWPFYRRCIYLLCIYYASAYCLWNGNQDVFPGPFSGHTGFSFCL